jgi:hypothetical protein
MKNNNNNNNIDQYQYIGPKRLIKLNEFTLSYFNSFIKPYIKSDKVDKLYPPYLLYIFDCEGVHIGYVSFSFPYSGNRVEDDPNYEECVAALYNQVLEACRTCREFFDDSLSDSNIWYLQVTRSW